jgi:hypothetical protein
MPLLAAGSQQQHPCCTTLFVAGQSAVNGSVFLCYPTCAWQLVACRLTCATSYQQPNGSRKRAAPVHSCGVRAQLADFFYYRYTFDDRRFVIEYADPAARQGRIFMPVSLSSPRQLPGSWAEAQRNTAAQPCDQLGLSDVCGGWR